MLVSWFTGICHLLQHQYQSHFIITSFRKIWRLNTSVFLPAPHVAFIQWVQATQTPPASNPNHTFGCVAGQTLHTFCLCVCLCAHVWCLGCILRSRAVGTRASGIDSFNATLKVLTTGKITIWQWQQTYTENVSTRRLNFGLANHGNLVRLELSRSR